MATDTSGLKPRMLAPAVLAIVLVTVAGASGMVRSVRPGADVADVIAGCHAGDTLLLDAGLYTGDLVLDRTLALIGRPGAVIRGSGKRSVVTITADSCLLAGLCIERSGSQLVDEHAGVLVRSTGNRIQRNELRDVLFGIYLLGAGGNTVAGNTIHGRPLRALGDRGSGIHIWNSVHNRIAGNAITDVRDGLYLQNANNTWIEDNRVTGVRYGLHYMYADSNVFLRNVFSDNVAGAAIMYSRGILMRHNVFAHNRGFSSFGVLFQDCHGLTADSNIIADNVVGMFFEASTDNTFRHNIIVRNDVALQMFQNSTGNVISGNNFVDNLSPLVIVGKRTGTRWQDGGRGNYWSSYRGYDLDGDGVGDVPMKIQNIFQYVEGRNPAARLFLYSPAAQALAVAAEAFPVIPLNEELDAAPLITPVSLNGLESLRLTAEAGMPEHAEIVWPISVAGILLAGAGIMRWRRRIAA